MGARKSRQSRIMLLGWALGVLTTPLMSAAFAASIVTCFVPELDCAALAIGAIDAARQEILVSAYALTNGSGFPAALARAHGRGVDVRLIADRRTPHTRRRVSARSPRTASRYGSMTAPGLRTKRRSSSITT